MRHSKQTFYMSLVSLDAFLDINECERGDCDPNADCVNTEGSFRCTCFSGYTGNGLNCTGNEI